ncbi:MAG: hypothetical protein JW927_01230 [Deltaproteobacteria bacterium]|nr:hypothetical protein [Deltaproteobacteria bacterium]
MISNGGKNSLGSFNYQPRLSHSKERYSSSASGRFTLDLKSKTYTITSPQGISKTFQLPADDNKTGIRELTHEVEKFVSEQGGTEGQIKAARKKLTEHDYHITK